ncbi:MAG: hypothetical protein HKO54_10950 [Flavobacteriaceae bacterium]|nr:hypothetical protein [Flavobacteriaceae bacterium]
MRQYLKPILLMLVLCTATLSCKKDDARVCTTCSSDITPTFQLCRESNGNASVNGEDTGTDYDLYLDDLEATGTNCGG